VGFNYDVKKPRVWPSLAVGLGALVVVGAISNLVLYLIISPTLSPGQEFGDAVIGQWMQQNMATLPGFLKMLIPIHLAMFLLAFIAASRSRTPLWERLGLKGKSIPISHYVLFSLAVFGVNAIAGWLFLAHIRPAEEQMTLAMAFTQGGGINGYGIALYTATIATFAEEVLFRGFVLRGLIRRWKPIFAIGLPSILFAITHPDPFFMLAALPISIWIGIIVWRTGSLWPALACHSFSNISLAILNRLYPEQTIAFFGELTLFPVLTGILGLVFTVISIRILFTKK